MLLTPATLKTRPSLWSYCFYMCRPSGEEKWWRNSWLTLLHNSHYNINIQSGHMKTLDHVSACRLMFGPFLFWRAAGLLQSISRSGFIWSIVCVHILYVCICLYMCPLWNLVSWNCVQDFEIDCGAAAGLLSPYFIEIDLMGHCSIRSIMASIPKPFVVSLPPTKSSD